MESNELFVIPGKILACTACDVRVEDNGSVPTMFEFSSILFGRTTDIQLSSRIDDNTSFSFSFTKCFEVPLLAFMIIVVGAFFEWATGKDIICVLV